MNYKKGQRILVKNHGGEWVEGRFVSEVPGSHDNYRYAVLIVTKFNEVKSINVAEENITRLEEKPKYKEGQKLLVQTGTGHWEKGKYMWENVDAPSKYKHAVRIDYANNVCKSINIGEFDLKPLKKESR